MTKSITNGPKEQSEKEDPAYVLGTNPLWLPDDVWKYVYEYGIQYQSNLLGSQGVASLSLINKGSNKRIQQMKASMRYLSNWRRLEDNPLFVRETSLDEFIYYRADVFKDSSVLQKVSLQQVTKDFDEHFRRLMAVVSTLNCVVKEGSHNPSLALSLFFHDIKRHKSKYKSLLQQVGRHTKYLELGILTQIPIWIDKMGLLHLSELSSLPIQEHKNTQEGRISGYASHSRIFQPRSNGEWAEKEAQDVFDCLKNEFRQTFQFLKKLSFQWDMNAQLDTKDLSKFVQQLFEHDHEGKTSVIFAHNLQCLEIVSVFQNPESCCKIVGSEVGQKKIERLVTFLESVAGTSTRWRTFVLKARIGAGHEQRLDDEEVHSFYSKQDMSNLLSLMKKRANATRSSYPESHGLAKKNLQSLAERILSRILLEKKKKNADPAEGIHFQIICEMELLYTSHSPTASFDLRRRIEQQDACFADWSAVKFKEDYTPANILHKLNNMDFKHFEHYEQIIFFHSVVNVAHFGDFHNSTREHWRAGEEDSTPAAKIH